MLDFENRNQKTNLQCATTKDPKELCKLVNSIKCKLQIIGFTASNGRHTMFFVAENPVKFKRGGILIDDVDLVEDVKPEASAETDTKTTTAPVAEVTDKVDTEPKTAALPDLPPSPTATAESTASDAPTGTQATTDDKPKDDKPKAGPGRGNKRS